MKYSDFGFELVAEDATKSVTEKSRRVVGAHPPLPATCLRVVHCRTRKEHLERF